MPADPADPLARAEALLAAADLTRGPWAAQHWDAAGRATVGSVVTPRGPMTAGDAALAAAARELLPALVARTLAAEAHARLMQRERDAYRVHAGAVERELERVQAAAMAVRRAGGEAGR